MSLILPLKFHFCLGCYLHWHLHFTNTLVISVFYKQLNRSVIILYYPYVGRCLVFLGYFGMRNDIFWQILDAIIVIMYAKDTHRLIWTIIILKLGFSGSLPFTRRDLIPFVYWPMFTKFNKLKLKPIHIFVTIDIGVQCVCLLDIYVFPYPINYLCFFFMYCSSTGFGRFCELMKVGGCIYNWLEC